MFGLNNNNNTGDLLGEPKSDQNNNPPLGSLANEFDFGVATAPTNNNDNFAFTMPTAAKDLTNDIFAQTPPAQQNNSSAFGSDASSLLGTMPSQQQQPVRPQAANATSDLISGLGLSDLSFGNAAATSAEPEKEQEQTLKEKVAE